MVSESDLQLLQKIGDNIGDDDSLFLWVLLWSYCAASVALS
jgi:hypothetical protein